MLTYSNSINRKHVKNINKGRIRFGAYTHYDLGHTKNKLTNG